MNLGSLGRVHARVVVDCVDTVLSQHPCHVLTFLARTGVDDAGTSAGSGEPDAGSEALLLVFDELDVVPQIRALNASPHNVQVPSQGLADVHFRGGGGRGGQSENRRLSKRFEGFSNEEIVRSEVVTPHADAMDFVDHHEADVDVSKRRDEIFLAQPLGGHVHELVSPSDKRLKAIGNLILGERRIDQGRGGGYLGRQIVDLVLHQCDEGRHNHRGSGTQHCRELVAE